MEWIGMEGQGATGPRLGTHCSRHRWAIGYTRQCYGQARTPRCTSNGRAMPSFPKVPMLFGSALQCFAMRGGRGKGTGNAINSNARVILDAGELNCSHYYTSSHLILPLPTSGSPLSAHHPLLFSFFSPVLFVPSPIISHLTSITPMGAAR
jgi:hypothetical protein